MFNSNLLSVASIAVLILVSAAELNAQNLPNDTRQEYVRSSSPTKSGGRVYNQAAGGQRMVRIARGPGSTSATSQTANRVTAPNNVADLDSGTNAAKYDYPELSQSDQVTAFRQAANLPPQLNFPPTNRLAQCCGVPVPPQQLQFQQPTIGAGFAGFQQPLAFPQQNFAAGFQQQPSFGVQTPAGFPSLSGIGVPQFNQTGGSWWTPFLTGSGYYTPLLNFRNMPAGTYLGQGLIGQPTAYVDRQPFRNLLRYISP